MALKICINNLEPSMRHIRCHGYLEDFFDSPAGQCVNLSTIILYLRERKL